MSWDSNPVRPGRQRQGFGREGNEMLLKAVRQRPSCSSSAKHFSHKEQFKIRGN